MQFSSASTLAISAALALSFVPTAFGFVQFRIRTPIAPAYGGQTNTEAKANAYAAVGPSGAIAASTAVASEQANVCRLMPDGTVRLIQGTDESKCVSSVSIGPSGTLSATQCQASSQKFTMYNGQLVPADGRCLQVVNSYYTLSDDCSSASAGAYAGAYVDVIDGTVPHSPYDFGYATANGNAYALSAMNAGDSEAPKLPGTLRVTGNKGPTADASENEATMATVAVSAMLAAALL